MENQELIQVQGLSKTFLVRKSCYRRDFVHAVKDVSFTLRSGETLALTGESGSGKTTVGRIILKLTEPSCGEVLYKGSAISQLKGEELRCYRKAVQAVFQDPHLSLNPKMTVFDIISEPLKNYDVREWPEMAASLLEEVGLGQSFAECFPHQLSGGQKQRVAIARALALRPEAVVMDEPLSALDISVQTQILTLLNNLKKRYNISFLLITHDLRVVRAVADRVAVMKKGELIEIGNRDDVIINPNHPYTKSLVSAMHILNLPG